jgi:hypothetical protein
MGWADLAGPDLDGEHRRQRVRPDQAVGQLLDPRAEHERVERTGLGQRRVEPSGAEPLEGVPPGRRLVEQRIEHRPQPGDLVVVEDALAGGVTIVGELGEQLVDVDGRGRGVVGSHGPMLARRRDRASRPPLGRPRGR